MIPVDFFLLMVLYNLKKLYQFNKYKKDFFIQTKVCNIYFRFPAWSVTLVLDFTHICDVEAPVALKYKWRRATVAKTTCSHFLYLTSMHPYIFRVSCYCSLKVFYMSVCHCPAVVSVRTNSIFSFIHQNL